MTTSGNTIYQIGRNQLIEAALRKLGALAKGQTPDTQDYNDASVALNMLVAQFRSIGMPLWARKEYTFNPVAGQQVYQIGFGKAFNTPYPLHVLQAFRQDSGSDTKVTMEVIPNYNINLYPTSSGGTPIQLSYQPFVNYGEITVWPVPDSFSTSSTITIIYQSPFQYFDTSTDTMDFPEEWYLAIVYNLASILAPEWTIPLDDRKLLAAEAKKYKEMAEENGPEDGSLFIQPGRYAYGNL
jgi:hypothetical protein